MSDHPAAHQYDPNRFPHFERPFAGEKFSDVMYAVDCDTRAKHQLIIRARDEFLSCWLSDKRMPPYLEGWSASVGLPEIINDVAVFLDRVTDRYGFLHRADLGRIPRPPHISVEDLVPEWCTLQERLYAAYRRGREVFDAIEVYVRDELRQPWPWLVGRLTHHVFQQAWEQAMGVTMIEKRTSPLDPMWESLDPVQPFRFVFETKPGEPVVEAKRRLMAEARDARKNLQAIERSNAWWDLPKGYPRKDQQENVIQDARWLYCQLLWGDIPRQMALAWHHDRERAGQHTQEFSDGCGCEQRVYRGLKKVADLLNSTPFIFADTDK